MHRQAAIETIGLKKTYGNLEALKSIDLRVEHGELFSFLGPNGAGKSTTIRILTGLTRMSGGQAWLNGFDIERHPTRAKRQFGVVQQQLNLDQELTVMENLDIHGQLFGMSRIKRRLRAKELLALMDMEDRANTLVKHLSGGLKRRVMFGRALLHSPAILFLDEPTAGLDAAIRRRIWGIIKEIQALGTTIFLTTHHIEEAELLSDRVAFVDEGRIVAVDTPSGHKAKVGRWAVDRVIGGRLHTSYFQTRSEALAFRQEGGFTLRKVNLEDAFLQLTGKKVKK